MTVGERIKSIRKEKGITQKGLGNKLGVSDAHIGQYERGLRNPKVPQLKKFAEVLDVPIDLLLADKFDDLKSLAGNEPVSKFSYRSFIELEQKLKHVGFSIGAIESEGYLWITYPDGELQVTDSELQTLNDSFNSFIRFALAELKAKNIADFRENKK